MHVSRHREWKRSVFAVLRREARLQLNIDSDQIHMISGNFSPANKRKGAAEMSQKLFLESSVRGSFLLPTMKPCSLDWNSPCMNTTAAGTQVGSSRDFHSKPEHTPPPPHVKRGWLFLHFISLPVCPLASVYIAVALRRLCFFLFF